MNDNELKKIWKDVANNNNIQFNHQKILNDMNNANQKLDRQIKWRNVREIGAAIFVIIAFSLMFFLIENYLVKLGAILVVFATIFIIFKLLQVRNKKQFNTIIFSIKDQLIHRKKYLQHEQALLKNIAYWYLFPLLIPIIIMEIGFGIFSLMHLLILGVSSFGLYVLNQKGAKKFDTYIEEIEHAIQQLDSE